MWNEETDEITSLHFKDILCVHYITHLDSCTIITAKLRRRATTAQGGTTTRCLLLVPINFGGEITTHLRTEINSTYEVGLKLAVASFEFLRRALVDISRTAI